MTNLVNRPMHSGYEVVSKQEIVTADFHKVRALAEMTVTEDTDVFVYGPASTAECATPRTELYLLVEAR